MAQVNLGHVVGPGVPTGGTANQVLVKNGATNFDTSWKDASQLPAMNDEATARDAADAALADGLAIIANGDTHAAVAAGQAVYVRSHSTLASGLYWASSAIGTNAALSTSNLTADASGGLNKLKADIDTLNSKFAYKSINVESSHTYQNRPIQFFKNGTTCFFHIDGIVNVAPGETLMCNMPTGFAPIDRFIDDRWINGTKFRFYLESTKVSVYNYGSTTFSDANASVAITYPIALES